ncbi:hypothetical protein [Paludisphaera sp.]|uniref:hypothetical protein n=1 Tax=Paludisphaera sp. TaxID=2017432 RepID=UPI00301C8151
MFIDDERTPGLLWIAVGAVATALALPPIRSASPTVAIACMAPGLAMIGLGAWSIWRVTREA